MMCSMRGPEASRQMVLYDADCGFCKVVLAVLLRWDRAERLEPVAIQSARGERLLSEMDGAERLRSWHLIDGSGEVHSAGAGIPAAFAALPAGAAIAAAAARFPGATARAYEWVAEHRAVLGRPLGPRSRSWAARVIAERARSDHRG
jgi:predicted DCC family thiol-disulfide oxidoreductase YuxK